ncbi:hypothetical protein QWY79_12225 [Halomonas sabkhae]|uniref:hypothetical protein n=1 Tax=Halomonas sabkhae TaxID=626223 RepID=UPI0025B3D32C|nr:hypothetical protein [Halomonas sabkhae]MDN3526031.1 hypothetical protein [Halomonas sabkhae]
MIIRLALCLLLSSAIGYLTYGDLEKFTLDAFVDVMGVLLNVSAIVFAIIGAWIAIIYPRALQAPIVGKRVEDAEAVVESTRDANYLSELFQIVLQSAFVIIFAVAAQVALPLFKAYSYFDVEMPLVKALAVSFMVFLAFVQLNAILVVVEKNFGLLLRVRRKNRDSVLDNDV